MPLLDVMKDILVEHRAWLEKQRFRREDGLLSAIGARLDALASAFTAHDAEQEHHAPKGLVAREQK